MFNPRVARLIRASRHYPWRSAAPSGGIFLAALLIGITGVLPATAVLLVALLAGAHSCFVSASWAKSWVLPAIGTNEQIARRDDANQRAGGVADYTDIMEMAGPSAMRARARTLRPSLRSLTAKQIARIPITEYAVPLVHVGGWLKTGHTVYSSCEEHTLRIGGPRMGKSGSMTCHAIDAPGALIVTSTRTDILEETQDIRSRKGRVHIFNPTWIGETDSTVRWTPLVGCTEFATARRRAKDLIPEAKGDGERWDAQARSLLAILMHASALIGGTMATVQGWVSPADEVTMSQVLNALAQSPHRALLMDSIRRIYTTNSRSLTSITMTMDPALRWIAGGTAAIVGDASLDDPKLLDVRALVGGWVDDDGSRRHDSLYLIGPDGESRQLVAALTSEVAYQARQVAGGGRLDPPMTMCLDEVPLTCGPIPLANWTADMGGRGVTMHLGAQSLAQLRDVYGGPKTSALLGNIGSLLVFGGLKNTDDLSEIATLTGIRLVQLDADDVRPGPVFTTAQVSEIPQFHCLVLRNSMRPLQGRAPMHWDRSRKPVVQSVPSQQRTWALVFEQAPERA